MFHIYIGFGKLITMWLTLNFQLNIALQRFRFKDFHYHCYKLILHSNNNNNNDCVVLQPDTPVDLVIRKFILVVVLRHHWYAFWFLPPSSTEIVYELTVALESVLISVHAKPPGHRSRLYPGIN